MKNIILLFFVILLLPSKRTSAQKCKLSRDEKDAFTGEITRTFSHYIHVTKDGMVWNIHFERKGNVYYWGYEPCSLGRALVNAPIGTKVIVKLENGTIIENALEEDVKPTFVRETTHWKLLLKVNEETMRKFAASPITDIKTIIAYKEFYVSDLKDRRANIIQNGANCIIAKD
jgi:hypothetical protein